MWCKLVIICVLYLVFIKAEDDETGTEREELKLNKELVTYAADNQEVSNIIFLLLIRKITNYSLILMLANHYTIVL